MTSEMTPKLDVMTLAWPTDWAALFGREKPLILEIGFGRGAFLLHLAQTYPDHNIIGIEISNRCLTDVERMLARHGVTNARVVFSMAETALRHLFVPASLEQVHINFPDPWFKTRHSHRRLMQRDTLDALISRLKPGGALYLATDIREYAEMSADLLRETRGLVNTLPTPWGDVLPGRIVTKYEATARREGRDCYYFVYRRDETPAPHVPVTEESPMPHFVFSSPLTLEDVEAHYAAQPLDELQPAPDTYIHIMRLWRSGRHLMFETHIREATIDQHMALVLSARDDGSYTVQMSTLGHPRPTEGVHHAVRALGAWLMAIKPGATVIVQKLQTPS
jgi:tRNA (guanine-N7-)-methyltransferase